MSIFKPPGISKACGQYSICIAHSNKRNAMLSYPSLTIIIAYVGCYFNPHFQQSSVMRFARFNGVLDNVSTESVSDRLFRCSENYQNKVLIILYEEIIPRNAEIQICYNICILVILSYRCVNTNRHTKIPL